MTDPIISTEKDPPGLRGINYAKAHRLFGIVLYHWCKHTSSSRDMRSIPFDKLVTLTSRLWNGLHKKAAEDKKADDQSCNSEIFRVPHRLLDGKHGPGHGIISFDTEKNKAVPIYIGRMLYDHYGLQIQQDINVSSYDRKGYVDHEETKFTTGLTPTLARGIMEAVFSKLEQHYIDELADAIKHLDENQIRALGTHENNVQTAKAIIFEFEHWCDLVDGSIELLGNRVNRTDKQGRNVLWYAQEAYEYAKEAELKTSTNEKAYEQAWEHFDGYLKKEGILFEVFRDKQKKAMKIWKSANVQSLRDDAVKAMEFSRVLRTISFKSNTRQNAALAKYKEDALKGVNNLREIFKSYFQQKLFNVDNFNPIEQYLADGKSFDNALFCLKNIKEDIFNSMQWKDIRKALRKEGPIDDR